MGDWTVRVAIPVNDGIVAVRNGDGRWHLPGGKKHKRWDDQWKKTGVRETREETGLIIAIPDGVFIGHEVHHNRQGKPKLGKRPRYSVHYCIVAVSKAQAKRELRAKGTSGEEVRVIPVTELRKMDKTVFHDRHKAYLKRQGLLS